MLPKQIFIAGHVAHLCYLLESLVACLGFPARTPPPMCMVQSLLEQLVRVAAAVRGDTRSEAWQLCSKPGDW